MNEILSHIYTNGQVDEEQRLTWTPVTVVFWPQDRGTEGAEVRILKSAPETLLCGNHRQYHRISCDPDGKIERATNQACSEVSSSVINETTRSPSIFVTT